MFASTHARIRRRLSLLASSSFAASAIALALGGGAALAPVAAHAANECGNPTANGGGADNFICSDTVTYTEIAYPTTSGNLTLRLQNDVTVTTGGIVITPSGANTVTINRIADTAPLSGDPQITSTTGPGISIIRASNNGNFTVNLTDDDTGDAPFTVTGTTAGIYLSNSGTGAQTLTTTNGTITATAGVGVRLGTIGTGAITFNNGSVINGTTGAILIAGGNNATVVNSFGGEIRGSITFDNTGTSRFDNAAVWRADGVSNFGSGTSTLTNDWIIAVSGATQGAATLTIDSVELFQNNGTILFGTNAGYTATDGFANDRLVTTGLIGAADSILAMDFLAGGPSQLDCAAAISGDCLDVRTGGAFGSGQILLNALTTGDGLTDRIVLIDGSGGVVSADYVISAASPGYLTDAGRVTMVSTGAYAYALLFDADNQQYYLAPAPNPEVVRHGAAGGTAVAAWDIVTGSWFDRQADLRDESGEPRGGVWLRATSGYVDNAQTQSFADGGIVFDTGYKQTAYALSGGLDIPVAPGLLAGVTASYVQSDVKFDAGGAEPELEGYGLGGYLTWLNDGFFVDAVANYLALDMASTGFSGDGEVTTFGAQVEGGYRFALAENTHIEPLAAAAFTNTQVGGAILPDGAGVALADATTSRAGVGVRVSAGLDMGEVTSKFALTGRVWQQFGDDPEVTISSNGSNSSFTAEDDRDTLGDVALSASLYGLAERLSLNLVAGLKFKEDYEAGSVRLGVRYSF